MTREQTSRIDTSTLLFVPSTTGMVKSFSSLVNKSDDALVERFLVFSSVFLVHFGSHLLFLIIFLLLTLSLFQLSLFLLVFSLFLLFLLPHPASHLASLPSSFLSLSPVLFWGQDVGNVREEVDGSGIPRWDTTNSHRNTPGHHLSHCPKVDLGNNDSDCHHFVAVGCIFSVPESVFVTASPCHIRTSLFKRVGADPIDQICERYTTPHPPAFGLHLFCTPSFVPLSGMLFL